MFHFSAVHVTLCQLNIKNIVINVDKRQIQHRSGYRRNLQVSESYDLGVLGFPAIFLRKHYWEVDASRCDAWPLGINDGKCAKPQLPSRNQQGVKAKYNSDVNQDVNYQPKCGYWVIGMRNRSVYNAFEECSVTHNASVLLLSPTRPPTRVEVFLDREACTLSFLMFPTMELSSIDSMNRTSLMLFIHILILWNVQSH